MWLGDGKKEVKENMNSFLESDIYHCDDTLNIFNQESGQRASESLEKLYMDSSKHSNYQILPSNLKGIIDDSNLFIQSRYEKERLDYIAQNINFEDKSVLDIGGNIGFFTFEACNLGAKQVIYYEGNKTHAEFVEKAAEILGLEKRIKVCPEYYLFDLGEEQFDIIFCLNVIHHLGDDFFNVGNMQQAKEKMLTCINRLAEKTDFMVFQMGFNWCGDKKKCLFEKGTKQEMEQYLVKGTEHYWRIVNIGIAEKNDEEVIYRQLSESNNVRIDEVGEFLNRPLFIMKSLKR